MPLMRKLVYSAWMLTAILASCGIAAPGGRRSLAALTAQADAVVVGSMQAVQTDSTVNATITVERAIKGTLAVGAAISTLWTYPVMHGEPGPPGNSAVLKGHGVFFLKQDTSGSWSLLPASSGDMRWEDTYIPTPSSTPPQVTATASASLTAAASALDYVLLEMVVAAEAGAPVPFDLISTFRQTGSPVLAAAFKRFLSSQDPYLKSIGLRGAVLSGDPSIVPTVRQNYSALSTAVGWIDLVQEIEFYYLNTSTTAVQNLGQVATDGGAGLDLRIAAAMALARMHTQQTLPYLATLLDAPNPMLKTAAVGGMAAFANNVPIGSHEPAAGAWPYRTDDTIAHSAFDETTVEGRESYYVAFWKAWWQQNQQALAPQ